MKLKIGAVVTVGVLLITACNVGGMSGESSGAAPAGISTQISNEISDRMPNETVDQNSDKTVSPLSSAFVETKTPMNKTPMNPESEKETVIYKGEKYNKDELSRETLQWLEWYNGLPGDGQSAVNFEPEELVKKSGDMRVWAQETENLSPETGINDILLSKSPEITLTDVLSSRWTEFSISSGSYSWTCLTGNEKESVIACGAGTLSAEGDLPELSVAEYNEMSQATYRVGCAVPPDRITLKMWDSNAAGNPQAEPVSITEYDTTIIGLEKNHIYELTAIWDTEKLEVRKYSGEGNYSFRTK